MKEPREFWINEVAVGKSMNGRHKLYTAADILPQNPGWIRVIEKSVYDELKSEAEKLKLDKEQTKAMLDVILDSCEKFGLQNEKLRAENETLSKLRSADCNYINQLCDERDELKREKEQLKAQIETLKKKLAKFTNKK